MATDDAGDGERETERLDVSTRIEDDRTVIEIEGDRSVAVVVRSALGERIYLPPEGFDRDSADDSPYQSARGDSPYQPSTRGESDSPYQSARDDSPYQSARTTSRRRGASLTADGVRVVHPEPATEFTLFR